MTPNRQAFLDMIGWSEGTTLIPTSDRGFNVIVGSTPENPDLFTSYADHPRKLVNLGNGLESTAAGKYQLLERYYDDYKASLNLPDFSPDSQDAIALQQIRECHALDDIDAGNIEPAIKACSRIWASLPGNDYGQRTNTVDDLIDVYLKAGGTLN